MSFMKGLGAGMLAGGLCGMMIASRKKAKTGLGKKLQTMGMIVDGVCRTFGV